MNQNPQSDPQRMPTPPGRGRDDDDEGENRMPKQHRYRRAAAARVGRPFFYCGCLTFIALIVLVIVLVVRGQPVQEAISPSHHALPLKIQAKHANMNAAAAPRINTELRMAKVKRNEPSAEKSKTKSENNGVVEVADAAAETVAPAEGKPAPKKEPKAAPHHFYHDTKKHGKKV